MDVDLPHQVGDFRLVVEDQLEFAKDVQIAKWQSESTGLKVVYSSNESEFADFGWLRGSCAGSRKSKKVAADLFGTGPLVQGYFSVVTEIQDGK